MGLTYKPRLTNPNPVYHSNPPVIWLLKSLTVWSTFIHRDMCIKISKPTIWSSEGIKKVIRSENYVAFFNLFTKCVEDVFTKFLNVHLKAIFKRDQKGNWFFCFLNFQEKYIAIFWAAHEMFSLKALVVKNSVLHDFGFGKVSQIHETFLMELQLFGWRHFSKTEVVQNSVLNH